MRAFGGGVSGRERSWRICGGNVGAIMGDVPRCSEDICDLRRERMSSFTEGVASFSKNRICQRWFEGKNAGAGYCNLRLEELDDGPEFKDGWTVLGGFEY